MIENLKKILLSDDKSPKFYQYYPRLFNSYFEKVSQSDVEELSNAGYLYYHSTLMMDSIIDDGNFLNFPLMIKLQETTIKSLTSIFGKESKFWDLWDERRSEYFEAVKIEKKLSNGKTTKFTAYADLADKKSAFGKIAVDSLWILSDEINEDTYKCLLESHKYFSIGFQLCDDVRDFKEDLEKGQFNWGINQLMKEVDFKEYGNNSEILNKLFFLRGVGQKILEQSIDNFQKALKIIKKLELESEWKDTT